GGRPRGGGGWRADGVAQGVEASLVRDALTVEQATDEANRLVEPVQSLAEARAEVEPKGVVLPLDPAPAEAEDRPSVAHVVQGGGQLRRQAGVAEGVGTDQQAEAHVARQRRPRRPRHAGRESRGG